MSDEESKSQEHSEKNDSHSPRIVFFDNAIADLVEKLFGLDSLTNGAAHTFMDLYNKDKELFVDSVEPIIEKANEDFCERIRKIIEEKKIEINLKKMDEAVSNYNRNLFSGKPISDVKKQMFSMKQTFLENNQSVVDEEYEKLTSKLDEEMEKYKDLSHQVSLALQEKDSHIQSYKKKIGQIDSCLNETAVNHLDE